MIILKEKEGAQRTQRTTKSTTSCPSWFFVSFVLLISFSCTDVKTDKKTELRLTRYVDPFIGTGFHGHVFLGASVPFGAVQLGPTNITEGWDWCSGYHYSDSTILGFS